MEHLKYIFSELGDTFKDAWTDINKKIPARRTKFKNSHDDGYDILIEFTLVNVEVATNVMNKFISYEINYEKIINDISDTSQILHATTRTSTKSQNQDKIRYQPQIKNDHRNKRNLTQRKSTTLPSKVPPHELIASTYRACKKARHEIFITDCDKSNLYYKCKATGSTITAKQRDKIIKNFEER